MVMAAAVVLLVAGSAKTVQPAPVAETLAELWRRVGAQLRGSWSLLFGRLLGGFEIGLAVAIVIERSAVPAVALSVFAVGLAAAGVVGIAGTSKVPCACFGRSNRFLGWPQVLQLPLWVAASWGVTRDASLLGEGVGPGLGLFMLACCAVVSTALLVVRLWRLMYPIAHHRRTVLNKPLVGSVSVPEGSAW